MAYLPAPRPGLHDAAEILGPSWWAALGHLSSAQCRKVLLRGGVHVVMASNLLGLARQLIALAGREKGCLHRD